MNKRIVIAAAASITALTLVCAYPASAQVEGKSSAQAVEVHLGGNSIITAPRTADTVNGKTVYGGSESPAPSNPLPGVLSLGLLTQHADSGANNSWGTADAEVASTSLSLVNIDGATAVDLPTTGELVQNINDLLNLNGLSTSALCSLFSIDPTVCSLGGAPLNAILDPILATLQTQLNGVTSQVTPVLTDLLTQLDTNVELQVGAVKSWSKAECIDKKTAVNGGANIDGAKVVATVGGQKITLLTLPSASAPNSSFTANTSALVNVLQTEAVDDAISSIDGIVDAGISPLYAGLTAQIKASLLKQVDDALKPLFDALNQNVLTGTVNKQTLVEHGLDVQALDLKVLPAAAQLNGSPVGEVTLAHSVSQAWCTDSTKTPPTGDPKDPNDPTKPSTPKHDQPTPDFPKAVLSGK